jgi:anaphase-promoting complex subunit 8
MRPPVDNIPQLPCDNRMESPLSVHTERCVKPRFCAQTNSQYLSELEASEDLFDQLLIKDPFRIEGIDVYSAILYVLRKKTKLSKLARRFSGMSRDRPEVCCVIGESLLMIYYPRSHVEGTGDHYSIHGEHEKAIKYYRRAVLLDQNCVGAWTLLGHSFVEMKNAHAAIESYRRAIGEFALTC